MGIMKTVRKMVMAATLGALLLGSASLHAVVWNRLVSKEDVLEKARPMSNVVKIAYLEEVSGQILNYKYEYSRGSGILIGPRHVLTVRHVASEINVSSKNAIVCLEDAAGNIETRKVIGVELYQTPEGQDGFFDVDPPAVIILDAPVDVEQFHPAELYRGSVEALCGEKLHGAGYGMHYSTDGRSRYEADFGIIDEDLRSPERSRNPVMGELHKRAYYERVCNLSTIDNCVSDYYKEFDGDQSSHLYSLEKSKEDKLNEYLKSTVQSLSSGRSAYALERVPLMFTTGFLNGLENNVECEFEGYPAEGDSGSPLFNDQDEIVALAKGGAVRAEMPYESEEVHLSFVMYTPVAPYSDWIQSVLDSSSR